MGETVAEEYKSSLSDLNYNSKPLINMLTMLADDNKIYANEIALTIIEHINSVPTQAKLPGMYLIDSILKTIGEQYLPCFTRHIVSLFTSVFEKVDEETRGLMFKLRQTWNVIFPNKILYDLDLEVRKIDPKWPVTAKPPVKKAHVIPQCLDKTVEQKKVPEPKNNQSHHDFVHKNVSSNQFQRKADEVKHVKTSNSSTYQEPKHSQSLKVTEDCENLNKQVKSLKVVPVMKEELKQVMVNRVAHKQEKTTDTGVSISKKKSSNVKVKQMNEGVTSKKKVSFQQSCSQPEDYVLNVESKIPTQRVPDVMALKSPSSLKKKNLETEDLRPIQVPIVYPGKEIPKKVSKKMRKSNKSKLNSIQQEKTKPGIKLEEKVLNIPKKKVSDLMHLSENEEVTYFMHNVGQPIVKQEKQKQCVNTLDTLSKKCGLSSEYSISKKKVSDLMHLGENEEITYFMHNVGQPIVKQEKQKQCVNTSDPLSKKCGLSSEFSISKKTVKDPRLKKLKEITVESKSGASQGKVNAKGQCKDFTSVSLWKCDVQPQAKKTLKHTKASPKSQKSSVKSEKQNDNKSSNLTHLEKHKTNNSKAFDNISVQENKNLHELETKKCDIKPCKSSKRAKAIKNFKIPKHHKNTEVGISDSQISASDKGDKLKRKNLLKSSKNTECSANSPVKVSTKSLKNQLKPPAVIEKSSGIVSANREQFLSDFEKPVLDINVSNEEHLCLKDEDLRIGPLEKPSLIKEMVKRSVSPEIPSASMTIEPERKKIKLENSQIEDSDNRMPDSPVLFGNEDQDLRQNQKDNALNDLNPKGWAQYKEAHPDEFTPPPFSSNHDGKWRFCRRRSFESNKNVTPYRDMFGHSRIFRGRYNSRFSGHRGHFFRGRGKYPQMSRFASMSLNPHLILEQAHAKYNSGQISESDYQDLRKVLQNILEKEYQVMYPPLVKQEKLESEMNSEELPEDPLCNSKYISNDVNKHGFMKHASENKRLFLDGKERFIQFVDDKAVVLMDEDVPHEIGFINEPKDVFIEGLARPLTLYFDGKPVEFHLNGNKHTMQFGNPGREVYIDKHPYEAKFGGPPFTVILNGHPHKVQLSGPPPQVFIGDKLLCEKFRETEDIGKELPVTSEEYKEEELDTKIQTPDDSALFHDTDMRVKLDPIQQSNISSSVPFCSSDVKDVDWRQIPVSNSFISHENPDMFKNEVPETCTWKDRNEVSRGSNVQSFRYDSGTDFQPHSTYVQSSGNPYEPSWEKYPDNKAENFDWRPVKNEENSANAFVHRVQFSDDSRLHKSHAQRMSYSRRPRRMFRSYYVPPNRNFKPRVLLETPKDIAPMSENKLLSSHIPPKPLFSPVQDFLHSMESTILDHKITADLPLSHESISEISKSASDASEMLPCVSDNSRSKVDVESLLEKLIAAGIINPKPEDQSSVIENPDSTTTDESTVVNESDKTDTSELEIPNIEFKADNLKILHAGVIAILHKGSQCSTCGMRFHEIQSENYSRHLDWHFRMNRQEKESSKKSLSRRWFYEIEDWIQFEEFEDFEERVPSYFELQTENEQLENLPVVPSVSVIKDEESCPVCGEQFEIFWAEEPEEWHLQNAERHDDVTYHPACYKDFRKEISNKKVTDDSNNSHPDMNISDTGIMIKQENDVDIDLSPKNIPFVDLSEIFACLDEIIDQISSELCVRKVVDENISEPEITDLELSKSNVKLEQDLDILEGKPGEEEIIDLNPEMEMVIDVELPKTESKMIVMQSGGITLKVKAESLQVHSPISAEKETKTSDNKLEITDDFRPPTPDPKFQVLPPVSKGRELSGLCSIM